MIAPPDPGPTIVPADTLMNLRRRLDALPSRHLDRKAMLESAAYLYGISRATLYRQTSPSPRKTRPRPSTGSH